LLFCFLVIDGVFKVGRQSVVGWGSRLAWGGWQTMADVEVRNQNFRKNNKHHLKTMLAINISPYFLSPISR
jgi:hypothetical protein